MMQRQRDEPLRPESRLRALCLGALLLALIPMEVAAGTPGGRFKAGSLEPPEPAPGWERLRWRLARWGERLLHSR